MWTWINYTLYFMQDKGYNTNMGQLLRTVINFIRHFYYKVFQSNFKYGEQAKWQLVFQ